MLEIVGSEDECEGAVGDDLGLLDRSFLRGSSALCTLIQNEPATPMTSSAMSAM